MPAGLQAWDANSRLVVDLTDRLAKTVLVGEVLLNPSFNRSIDIYYPGLQDDQSWSVTHCGGVTASQIFTGFFRLTCTDSDGGGSLPGGNVRVYYGLIKQ